jgi:hypothetical protein
MKFYGNCDNIISAHFGLILLILICKSGTLTWLISHTAYKIITISALFGSVASFIWMVRANFEFFKCYGNWKLKWMNWMVVEMRMGENELVV